MALRIKVLVIAAVAAALLASAAAGYDWKIWVSVDGNAPPEGYNPDYETTYVGDVSGQGAIWYINNTIKFGGVTLPEDTVEVWIDAGEYNDPDDWNGFWWSGFNRIHNLYLHGYSADPAETVINGNYRTQQGNAYEEHTLILWDIHNGRVEDLTIKGGRVTRIIDPAKKRAWMSVFNIVEIDPGGTTWSVYTREGELIAGGIALGTALTGAQAEDQQPDGVGLGTGGFLRVDEGVEGDKAYFSVTTWPIHNWSYDYGGHGFMAWKQDGTVEGDVKGEIQTGDFLKQPEEIYAGNAVIMRSSIFDPDWYDAYTTVTFTNCVFSDSGQGLNVVDTCGNGTGPGGETAEVNCVDCTFRNLQIRAVLYNWSNGSFENCTFDTVGRNYTYSDYEDSVGNWDTGRGIQFQPTDNIDWQAHGPFTMEILGCDFMHVREVDSNYIWDGCCILYEDPWGFWPGNYDTINIVECLFDDTGPVHYLRDHSFDTGAATISRCESTGSTGPTAFCLELNGMTGDIEDCSATNGNSDWYEYYAHSGFYLGGNQGDEPGQLGAAVTCSECSTDCMPSGFGTNDTANVILEDCIDTNGGLDFWSAGYRSTGTLGGSDTVIRRCATYGHSSLAWTNQGYQGDCGPLLIEDSVFADFASYGLGFGNYTDQAVIRNCTIADSWPGYGGEGISLWWNPHYVVVDSCIIANMDGYGVAAWSTDSVVDISYSDVYNCLAGAYYSPGPPDGGTVNEGAGMIYADPLFVGGGDYHLTMNSPCIDAGNPSIAPSDFDWEGDSRVVNDRVDMGADEYLPILTEAPDPEPYSDGALFGAPGGGYPGWVWFSIPLTPDCPIGGGCGDPNTLLGFECDGSLFYWDKYGKFAQVYQPPFVLWDLFVGDSYLLQLTGDVPNPSYEGLSPFIPGSFEFKLGKMGWTWVGMPGLTPLTGDDFMDSVMVKYLTYDMEYRTAAEDYAATPDNWISWGWSFYDTYAQAAKTFTPYAPFGNRTCHPWLGYRVWVNIGTAAGEDGLDQVTLIWPKQ